MPIKIPDRFCDPLRLEIAISQIKHDLRKLLPDMDMKEWEKIDRNVEEWPSGKKFEIAPISDFWNFFGGFARGLKLKSLLNWITADNVEWSKKTISIDDAVITWDFPGFEFLGRSPYKIGELRKKLEEADPKIKKDLLKESDSRSWKFPPRDHFGIILINNLEGNVYGPIKGYYALEGNRRLVRFLLYDKKTVSAYIGKLKDGQKWPSDYWLRLGITRDLIFLAHYYNLNNDEKAFEIVRKFYQLLLRDFTNTRNDVIDEAFKHLEKDEKLLKEIFFERIDK